MKTCNNCSYNDDGLCRNSITRQSCYDRSIGDYEYLDFEIPDVDTFGCTLHTEEGEQDENT